jgi:DNA repair protein RecO (recombination protein O)
MKQLLTKGIVLSRTDYGEADRILTLLTPEQGKLRLMARGVRRAKSKLAGGIELFSTSDITYMPGRGEIGTLISTRLIKYYDHIVKDINRVQLGYELIKTLNRATEDHPETDYYELLEQAFGALDNSDINLDLIRAWFEAHLLYIAGHTPNLRTDTAGHRLEPDHNYNFDFDSMAFVPNDGANFTAAHIKVLRLLFSPYPPERIANVQGVEAVLADLSPLLRNMLRTHIRI